jgi:hypothetical protein
LIEVSKSQFEKRKSDAYPLNFVERKTTYALEAASRTF